MPWISKSQVKAIIDKCMSEGEGEDVKSKVLYG